MWLESLYNQTYEGSDALLLKELMKGLGVRCYLAGLDVCCSQWLPTNTELDLQTLRQIARKGSRT